MNTRELRIHGIYEQAQAGRYMLRAKVPGGLLTSGQAEAAAGLAEELGSGVVHLTTRMSLEFHDLAASDLQRALDALRGSGLTSRGACGGALRGVAVSTPFAPGCSRARDLARRIHEHFTGNPEFEGLPKKFKVGVDVGYSGSRHLIQDVGLVYTGEHAAAADEDGWDVWLAGGLGREPTAGFLFARALPEPRVVPLIAEVMRLYKDRLPAGKRLKHLVRTEGRASLEEPLRERLDLPAGRADVSTPAAADIPGDRVPCAVARVFAGELPAGGLRTLSGLARRFSGGVLCLTPDQDVALFPANAARLAEAQEALTGAGFGPSPGSSAVFRVCPGSHECRVGLARTRDVALALEDALGPRGRRLAWAVSGCSNSCAQPQLADAGVVCVRLERNGAAGEERRPLFDLLRREGEGLGEAVLRRAPLEELLAAARALG